MNMNNKMQNIGSILKVVAVTAVTIAACRLAEYEIADYQARAIERQDIQEQARIYKSHPLVINGCDTDLECEDLDYMLDVIDASYDD